MTASRRNDAVVCLSRLQLTNSGSLVTAGLRVLEAEDGVRSSIGSVTVPFGICVEPSNVNAGGHSCPYRMRCLGCSHFRTDPSYLPELHEYLSQLLMTRERLLAATDDEIEPWARHAAMPDDEEVERVRHLIRRCQTELDQLGPEEHEEIERCVAQARNAPAQVTQSVPVQLQRRVRTAEPSLFPGTTERLRIPPADTGVVR